jgi:hypothetical protein
MTEATHANWTGSFEDVARCPHCGEPDDFAGDHPSGLQHDGDSTEMDCGSCGEPYEVTMSVSVDYATKPLFIGPKRNFAHWCQVRQEMRERGELPPLRTKLEEC